MHAKDMVGDRRDDDKSGSVCIEVAMKETEA